MRRGLTALVVLGAFLGVPAAAPAAEQVAAAQAPATDQLAPADWPGYRNREGSGGFSRGEQLLTPATVGGLRRTGTSPVADNRGGQVGGTGHGLVYRSGAAGGLAAHDLASGALVWSAAEGSNKLSVGPTAVYTVAPPFGIAAYRPDTGALIWRRQLAGLEEDAPPPTLVGGQLLIGLRLSFGVPLSSEVVSLSTATGEVQWRRKVGRGLGGQLSRVAVWGSTAVVEAGDQDVIALDLSTGTRRWVVRSDGSGGGIAIPSPVVRSTRVYVGLADGVFRALDRATGRTLWTRDLGGAVFTSAAEGDGVVYATVSADSGRPDLWALDAATGAVRWSTTTGSAVSSPTLANGVLYVGAGVDPYPGGALKAYDAATGALLGSWPIEYPVSEPMVSHGKVWIVSTTGVLYEFTR